MIVPSIAASASLLAAPSVFDYIKKKIRRCGSFFAQGSDIYVNFEVGEKICGLAAYSKAANDSLEKGEKNAIKKLISKIEPYYNTSPRKK